MASSKSSSSPAHPSSMQIPFLICLLLISLLLLLSALSLKPQKSPPPKFTYRLLRHEEQEIAEPPAWFDFIARHLKTDRVRVGLVNIDQKLDASLLQHLPPRVETVPVNFDRVDENLKWKDFFPEWIDEDQKRGPPRCPRMPMPVARRDLNVVVARVPCGRKDEGVRDVSRLQVNLVVANLTVESGWLNVDSHRTVYVVFVGRCSPMIEIFRCDDLVTHEGEYWVYKPQLSRLRKLTLMPVGSCQIAPNFAETGKELRGHYMSQSAQLKNNNATMRAPRVAYATILHSSEAYVCGAIALAQSILHTLKHYPLKPSADLILLADESISPKSTRGLQTAGWKIKRIKRILSPFAKKNSYNRWNYSKLQLWKLTQYDKVIFIDSDLLVLKNIHDFSAYPQLSAAPNDFSFFNSGLMIIEPSQCLFDEMMKKRFEVESYNGGDQGFLNEIFTWWHRLPSKLNHLKFHERRGNKDAEKETELEGVYAIHYLGLKPWMCYKDYDCNWDLKDHRVFASDFANRKWWQVYEKMPKDLQSYCGLTKKMDERLMMWRSRARNSSLDSGHWKIKIKDPRRKHFVG
ncbi:putative UDP-glucuronate:xylan alpha-glucuronosyltransferase 4 [Prosopis cineraria]|uniref:putative UDP-glucuronate:xylan alpha-glucuronosyltransferase 4 n=1 Tax=Prosopis cineraria TaxID=364024 RepID=UPI00240EE9D6|nr:putative UDP-glucuronate:xylan alpha-glucuronosyltransferase 4 [Prosopis cineraria]